MTKYKSSSMLVIVMILYIIGLHIFAISLWYKHKKKVEREEKKLEEKLQSKFPLNTYDSLT